MTDTFRARAEAIRIDYRSSSDRVTAAAAEITRRGKCYRDVREWALTIGGFRRSDIPERGRNPLAMERYLDWLDSQAATVGAVVIDPAGLPPDSDPGRMRAEQVLPGPRCSAGPLREG